MVKRQLTTAIIDDGINQDLLMNGYIERSLDVLENGKVTVRTKKIRQLTHGTRCAQILTAVYKNAAIIDIKVLDSFGECSVSSLVSALDWCLKEGVDVINLSLGTLNYHDIRDLYFIVEKIIKHKTVIVAAYHNAGIISYPAAFQGVFGVRQDSFGLLGNGEWCFKTQSGLRTENCIIASSSELTNEENTGTCSNSYAAPVISAEALLFLDKCLEEERGHDCEDFIAYLLRNANNTINYPKLVEKVNQYLDQPVTALMLAAHSLTDDELICLIDYFTDREYIIEVLSIRKNNSVIPIDLYLEGREISLQFIRTMEWIYKPDLIIIDIDKKIILDRQHTDGVIDKHLDEIVFDNGKQARSKSIIRICELIEEMYRI